MPPSTAPITHNVNEVLDWLGYKVKDRVTGFEGVVASVNFDLYGCIQAVVTPSASKEFGEGSRYFDLKRLERVAGTPVMERPAFSQKSGETLAKTVNGPAEKPAPPC